MADISSYPRAPVYQPAQAQNPLAMLSQGVNVMSGLNQNQLFQQTFQARKAIGEIYPQAIDPSTGELDTNKLMALVSRDPRAAFMAGDVSQQAITRQYQQEQIGQMKLQNAATRLNQYIGVLSPLAANPNLSLQDITDATLKLKELGLLTPQEATKHLLGMPKGEGGGPPTPDQLRKWVQGYLVQGLDAQGRFNAQIGQPHQVDTGAEIVIGRQNQEGFSPQTVVKKEMDPATATAPVQVMIPDGHGGLVPSLVSREMLKKIQDIHGSMQTGPKLEGGLAPEKLNEVVRWTGPDGKERTAKFKDSPFYSASSTGEGKGVVTGPGMGAKPAAEKAASSSADMMTEAYGQAEGSAARMFQLHSALDAIKKADIGPGSESVNQIRSFILAQQPEFLKKLGINIADVEKVKNYDEAKKYLTQFALGQSGSFGKSTDARLSTTITGNPNMNLSKLAAIDLTKASIGLERMGQARALAFTQSQLPPEQYAKWSAEWSRTTDPRVFIVDMLDPEPKKKLINSLKGEEEKRFREAYNFAHANNLIVPPGAQQ